MFIGRDNSNDYLKVSIHRQPFFESLLWGHRECCARHRGECPLLPINADTCDSKIWLLPLDIISFPMLGIGVINDDEP